MSVKSKKVEAALTSLAGMKDVPQDEKGNLDVQAFNKRPEVLEVKSTLKELGVDRAWLGSNGFMAAAMVLIFED